MKRQNKNSKAGFTLVELMLAIAIILLISGLFVSLVIATNSSYYTTYNYNDSTDYCQLFGKIIQDQILSDRQDDSFTSGTSHSYLMNSSTCQFCRTSTGTPIVEVPRVADGSGTMKWIFAVSDVSFDTDSNIVTIKINVIDNYRTPGDVLYNYNLTFWVPNLENSAGDPVGDSITVARGTNHPVTTGGATFNNYEIVVNKV